VAGNQKKSPLDLGGKSPNIVLKDVGDLDTAITGAPSASFSNTTIAAAPGRVR
jgi:acyl-CoA reductase-like NAD-dependent aldehyde dehydrogenase